MKRMAPSTNGTNGRGRGGQFTTGNTFGRGNPFGRQCAQLRAAFMNALTCDDVEAVARELVAQAKAGNLAAIKLVLAYGVGAPHTEPAEDSTELAAVRLELETEKARKSLRLEQAFPSPY